MDKLRLYLSSFKLFLKPRPNKVILGRWCSSNLENKDNVIDVLSKLGNYDNCYVNTFQEIKPEEYYNNKNYKKI